MGSLFNTLFLWREWCWSWNSSTLATSCEELTHWKRLWCWEGLGAGGGGDDRRWDGWMASLTRWTWVWVNSRSWWWTGRPGVLWFMGSQRVGRDWATKLNWTARYIHWKDWSWSLNSNTLATWCEKLTHWKRIWCSEGLKAGGQGDDREWDGWMASPAQWTWVWASSGSWWWTGKPGMLQSMGSQRVSDLTERLNWTERKAQNISLIPILVEKMPVS